MEQQKADTQRTCYQTRNTFRNRKYDIQDAGLHIAYSPAYCIYTHRIIVVIDWLKSHYDSLSNTIIKLDSNC